MIYQKVQSFNNKNYYYEAGVCIFHFKYLWKYACAAVHWKFELTKGGACARGELHKTYLPFFAAAPAAFAWQLFHNERIAYKCSKGRQV